MTWINRYNADPLASPVKDVRGNWINGKFDLRMAGGVNLFGYDTTVWDKVKQESMFMFSSTYNTHNIYHVLAKKLIFRTLDAAYFCGTSGSDAVEAAIRCAYKLNKNAKIATRAETWHGATFLASNLGNHTFFDDFKDMFDFGIVRKPFVRSKGYSNLSDLVKSDIEFLKQYKNIGVFIIEPIPTISCGLSYKLDRPDAYNELRKYCDDNNIILIFDESNSCFKVGKRYFTEYLDIDPDILILAKAITSGIAPFSVLLGKKEYLQQLIHGHTYSAQYLGAVAANHTIDYFYETLPNSQALNDEFEKYFDYVLGSMYSINKDKTRPSNRVLRPSTIGYEYDNLYYLIPPNTPRHHLEFVVKETIL